MELKELRAAIEGILFAAGEPVKAERIAAVLAVEPELVLDAASQIAEELRARESGIRLVRLDNMLQLCSAPEYADLIRQTLETRKPPRLTPAALEVLSIVAYFQPVTRAYIEGVRGVDSSYTVSALEERGLIEPCGHLDAPGRPTVFRTTPAFLRVFGMSSISELPDLPEAETGGDEAGIISSINALKAAAAEAGDETPQEGAGGGE